MSGQETTQKPVQPDKRLQFSLRTLLLVTGLFAVCFGVFVAAGAVWSLSLFWAALLIAAHVFGNSWGTRITHESAADHAPRRLPLAAAEVPQLKQRYSLQVRKPLGYSLIAAGIAGAIAGSALGAYGLAQAGMLQAGLAGYLLGVASSAVLGGLGGFMLFGLAKVATSAMQDTAPIAKTSPTRPGPQAPSAPTAETHTADHA